MEHVSVKVALTHRVFLQGQVYRMPRNVKGIGRTGKKHKKPATTDILRQPKNQEAIQGQLFTQELQQGSTTPDKDTVEVMGDNDLDETDRPAAQWPCTHVVLAPPACARPATSHPRLGCSALPCPPRTPRSGPYSRPALLAHPLGSGARERLH